VYINVNVILFFTEGEGGGAGPLLPAPPGGGADPDSYREYIFYLIRSCHLSCNAFKYSTSVFNLWLKDTNNFGKKERKIGVLKKFFKASDFPADRSCI
jgi:hypothetical protein